MLSIAPIQSSAVASKYFERDDYYLGDEKEGATGGVWWGKGAKRLGLTGEVDQETFRDILDGKLPTGDELGTGREKKHRPGWDLTFSAPKSVSILAEVGGDQRLLEAHDRAVTETLTWMQEHITTHRARGIFGIRPVETDNLVVALFRHHTSRNQDAQTHTHAVLANVVRSQDRRWVSLNSELFYDHKMLGGNIYRAALAREVQKLGYAVERIHRDGRWEIASVPADVREAFSTRAAEIREAMAERGLEGAAQAEQAALRTRARKAVVPRAALENGWRDTLSQLGFDVDRAVQEARDAGNVTPKSPPELGRAVTESITRLSDNEAVFSRGELLRWSLAGAMVRGDVASMQAQIEGAARDGDLQPSSLRERPAWTTPTAQEQERRVLMTWERGRGRLRAPLTDAQIRVDLDKTRLTPEQRPAAELLLSSTDRFTGIIGRAGVGKTFMLGQVRPILEAQGFRVKGLAANSEAARTLEHDAKIASSTLHKHLNEVQRDLVRLRRGNPLEAAMLRAKYSTQLWVIDEGSQVDSKLMRKTMFAADRLGARVTIIGDTKQLAAIGAGKPFALLLKAGMRHAEMKAIIRQKDATQREAIEAVYRGNVQAAMTKLRSAVREIDLRDQRLDAIVDAWKSLNERRAGAIVLTARNAERTEINERLRAVLRAEGKLSGERSAVALQRVFAGRMDKVEAELYRIGDLVLFGRAVPKLGAEARSYWRVAGVDRARNELILRLDSDPARSITWNPRSIAAGSRNGPEIFRERATSLAPGEKIQWGINDRRFANGQVLTVARVDRHGVEVVSDAGRKFTLDPAKPEDRHFDHAYATTVYKSQGRTEQTVLVNAESHQTELFNQKAFLVAISRQRERVMIFTDDAEDFTRNVAKRQGDKTSAREGTIERRVVSARETLDRLFRDLRGRVAGARDRDGADREHAR